jgi:superfamily I DNA/RNA helicase
LEDLSVVDFDDMIWLPLVHQRLKLNFEKFDFVFVDETQDLNKAQIEFVMNSLQPETGRIVAVGDRKQSLYGFRGADVEAIPRMIEMLNAKVLPLSISYRCPKLVVEAAKELVPQIEAFENQIDGEILEMKYPEFMNSVKVNDMVICRTNAPLVKPAFVMIRRGIKAIIRGQDIGEALINFVERFNAQDLMQLESLMAEWTEKEHSRLIEQGKELAAEMVVDKHETLMGVASQCRTVMELVEKLRMLFSDKVEGVVFSSVHRAKGLEAESVYILHRELMPHPRAKMGTWEEEQEWNTKYVAITRSKNRLIWVLEDDDD